VQPQILSDPNRPEIKDLKLTWFDIVCEIVALLLLVIIWAAAVHYYKSLPELVPRFSLSRHSAESGNRASVFAFPTLTTMIYFLLLGTNFISPRLFNYPVRITTANARAQYTLARQMLSVAKVWVMAMFAYIIFGDFGMAWRMPGGHAMGWAALLIVIGAIVAFYRHRAKRAQ